MWRYTAGRERDLDVARVRASEISVAAVSQLPQSNTSVFAARRDTARFPPGSSLPALPFASAGCCAVSGIRELLWWKPSFALGFGWISFQLLTGLTV